MASKTIKPDEVDVCPRCESWGIDKVELLESNVTTGYVGSRGPTVTKRALLELEYVCLVCECCWTVTAELGNCLLDVTQESTPSMLPEWAPLWTPEVLELEEDRDLQALAEREQQQ